MTRHNFNAVVTPFMLSSTFLVPFEAAVRNPVSPAKGVMCSYNAVNGEPSCANTVSQPHAIRGVEMDRRVPLRCGRAVG